VFLTIDLTSRTLREAITDENVGYIVAYHPLLFSKINRICLDDPKQAIAAHCLAYGISVYSPHTSFDRCANGINDWLARGVGEGRVVCISPLPSSLLGIPGQESAGNGRILTLDAPVTLGAICKRLKKHLGIPTLRVAGDMNAEICRIAICAGSGSSLLSPVDNVDMYLSGEMGHHDLLDALERYLSFFNRRDISVVLCEHSASSFHYSPLSRILSRSVYETRDIASWDNTQ
jgi:dinuclear metal center YbgI/SA1388 family protein